MPGTCSLLSHLLAVATPCHESLSKEKVHCTHGWKILSDCPHFFSFASMDAGRERGLLVLTDNFVNKKRMIKEPMPRFSREYLANDLLLILSGFHRKSEQVAIVS